MADDATDKSLMETIMEWPLSRKLSLVAVALISLAFFAAIIIQAQKADYRLLYANLSEADASSVVEWLKDQKIPYQLASGGGSVQIPADKVYETRLTLAGLGIPRGGGIGFEIFDKQSFGMTDFAQKVNYQRALQGELSRTISSLAPVEGAKVLLALPEKRLFKEQQKAATASVIVKLTPGLKLKENQVQGIVHLVAGSIEGLDTENITVVDASGQILSKKTAAQTEDSSLTPGMLNFQQTMEHRLEARAQSLLDRALGIGNSLVRVTAELDFAQVEKTEETYDPNSVVPRSEQNSEESSGSSTSNSGGVPGVQSNLKGGGSQAGTSNSSTRSSETINYEISKVISRTVAPIGAIKNLSVAVLVGNRKAAATEDEETTPSAIPRTPEELLAIENMVKSALGLDNKRGDQIKVVSMPFEDGFDSEKIIEPETTTSYYEYLPYIKYGLLFLGAMLVYFLLVRPIIKTMQAAKAPQAQAFGELDTEFLGQENLLPGGGNTTQQLRKEILKSELPPTQVIKAWISK